MVLVTQLSPGSGKSSAWTELLRTPRFRPFLYGAIVFSLMLNVLLLVAPVYMLQIYDRVLTSGSVETLLWISVVAVILLSVYAFAEAGRRRVFALAAVEVEDYFAEKLLRTSLAVDHGQAQYLKDHSALQSFQQMLRGSVFAPFFDVPFVPFFLCLLFFIHPVLGGLGIIGAGILLVLAFVGQRVSAVSASASDQQQAISRAFVAGIENQRSAILSMGMEKSMRTVLQASENLFTRYSLSSSMSDGIFAGASKAVRQTLQIAMLGVGGYLALHQQISAGAIVASSIMLGRALGPIDQIVGGWRQIQQSLERLSQVNERAKLAGLDASFTSLPKPDADLVFDHVGIGCPGLERATVQPFSLLLTPSSVLSVVGTNGSGKSSLLQTVVGVWPAIGGIVRLGGRDIHRWDAEDRGRYIGYLPQKMELLPGTVRENISRYGEMVDDAEVFKAARLVGAHEAILSLPDGYDTEVGPHGVYLSQGQAQLVGLARACFAEPALLVLDEPTANLDFAAASIVVEAFKTLRMTGACIVIASHDTRIISASDQVLGLSDGRARLGTPESVLPASRAAVTNLSDAAQAG